LSVASKALKLAVAVSFMPSLASALAAPVAPVAPSSKFNIQVHVSQRIEYQAWQVRWSFYYRGTLYNSLQLWDADQLDLRAKDQKSVVRALVKKSTPYFEQAMKRKLKQVMVAT